MCTPPADQQKKLVEFFAVFCGQKYKLTEEQSQQKYCVIK